MPQQVSLRRGWWLVLVSAGLAVALFAGYKLSQFSARKTITVAINGQVYRLDTDASTVQTALDRAGVVLDPEDRVVPALVAPVEDGDTVSIWKAHAIALEADGEVRHLRTRQTHPLDILADYHITLDPADVIRVDGRDFAPDQLRATAWTTPAHHIAVLRHVTITVIEHDTDGDRSSTIQTTQPDVARALDVAGFELYLADRVTPDLSDPLSDGLLVEIERSMPVTVTVDGHTLTTRAAGPTISDGLAGIGIALVGEDYTHPAEDTPLEPGMEIQVVRVTEKLVIEREPVPFETIFQPDAAVARGAQRERQSGQAGERELWQRVRYEDGIEVTRTLVQTQIIVPPTARIVLVGTSPTELKRVPQP